jgi:hypothetical protein
VALGGTSYALTLGKNSIGAKQIKRNAVGASEIRKGAVRSNEVKNGSLFAGDFHPDNFPRATKATRATRDSPVSPRPAYGAGQHHAR